MLSALKAFALGTEVVGDVRGKGLMFGIEFVKDRETKEPWPETVREIRTRAFRSGLIVEVGGHYSNVGRFLPPLLLTAELAQKGLSIFLTWSDRWSGKELAGESGKSVSCMAPSGGRNLHMNITVEGFD